MYYPYNFPGKPVPIADTIPFSQRDGSTYLEKLEKLSNWMLNYLIPWIDTSIQGFGDQVIEAITHLEGAINEARESAAEAEESAQGVADILAAARVVEEAIQADRDAVEAAISQFMTDKEDAEELFRQLLADTREALSDTNDAKRIVEDIAAGLTQDAIVLAIINTTNGATRLRLDALYKTVNADVAAMVRQSGTNELRNALAEYFLVKPKNRNVLVVLGSSNAVGEADSVGGIVASKLGMTLKNYSQSGYSFMNDKFYEQALNAKNDTSLVKDNVGIVLIIDDSNEMRAYNDGGYQSPDTYATSMRVFNELKSTFPNARIVVVPALWPPNIRDTSSLAAVGGHQAAWSTGLTRTARILRNSAAEAEVEYIDKSWTWHAGEPAYQVPTEVHFTSLGRLLSARNIVKYLKTYDCSPYYAEFVNASPLQGGIDIRARLGTNGLSASRDGDDVSWRGCIFFIDGFPAQTDVGIIPLLARPDAGRAQVFGYKNGTDQVVPLTIYGNGSIRLERACNAGDFVVVSGGYNVHQ